MVRPLTLDDALKSVDSSKRAWDEVQPLQEEAKRRLWQKLRLEWNYNSNHIEGNTLTYGETELLLIFGQTDGRHSIREFEEMKAHDAAIAHVRELAESSRVVSEADIRNLNRMILKEPFWKPAVTSDGQDTQKRVIPGEYKTTPNNVRTATGEIFHFADPFDTPAKMHELVARLQQWLANGEDHVCRMISRLHHEFVLIHPFDDGNGRVARLLMNYVLMRAGFPPIIIKSKDKQNYLAALNQADTGNLDAFTLYLANETIWSLDLGLRAASGASIEDRDDLDKEIAIFAKKHAEGTAKAPAKAADVLQQCAHDVWLPLLSAICSKVRPIASLFSRDQLVITQEQNHGYIAQFTSPGTRSWTGSASLCEFDKEVFSDFAISSTGIAFLPDYYEIEFKWSGFSSPDCSPFDYNLSLDIELREFTYSVILHGKRPQNAPSNNQSRFYLANETVPLIENMRYDLPSTALDIDGIARLFAKKALGYVEIMTGLSKK